MLFEPYGHRDQWPILHWNWVARYKKTIPLLPNLKMPPHTVIMIPELEPEPNSAPIGRTPPGGAPVTYGRVKLLWTQSFTPPIPK